jgi:SAM-dependent methyltransferase
MLQINVPTGLDHTGKKIFSDVYVSPDPIGYFEKLCAADYLIPEVAREVFRTLFQACRATRGRGRLTVVDVGCSYGVNAAIHRYGLALGELQARYASKAAQGVRGRALLVADRAFYRARSEVEPLDVVGLDVSGPAVAYAEAAGIMMRGLQVNLEAREPTLDEAQALAGADIVISTGAVGYVTATTFERIIRAASRPPWVAAFVLRQFEFDPIAAALEKHGYVVETLPGTVFPQRRFVDPAERRGALTRLSEIGRAPTALEDAGWYASEVWLARPRKEADIPFTSLVPLLTQPASMDVAAA